MKVVVIGGVAAGPKTAAKIMRLDPQAIKTLLAQAKGREVVTVGGGLIGVETAEALAHYGCRVSI
jgi:NADPH-dependent 2,4-dienoyl-CoA reductase/sulfur reductase-like enzyme